MGLGCLNDGLNFFADSMIGSGSKSNKKEKRRGWRILLFVFLLVVFLAVSAVIALYFTLIFDLPRLTTLKDYQPYVVSEVYSDDEVLIGEFFIERRMIVPLA